MTYYHQYLRIGLSFVPIFITMIQSHLHLINYLSLHIELIPMEIILIAGIKRKTF